MTSSCIGALRYCCFPTLPLFFSVQFERTGRLAWTLRGVNTTHCLLSSLSLTITGLQEALYKYLGTQIPNLVNLVLCISFCRCYFSLPSFTTCFCPSWQLHPMQLASDATPCRAAEPHLLTREPASNPGFQGPGGFSPPSCVPAFTVHCRAQPNRPRNPNLHSRKARWPLEMWSSSRTRRRRVWRLLHTPPKTQPCSLATTSTTMATATTSTFTSSCESCRYFQSRFATFSSLLLPATRFRNRPEAKPLFLPSSQKPACHFVGISAPTLPKGFGLVSDEPHLSSDLMSTLLLRTSEILKIRNLKPTRTQTNKTPPSGKHYCVQRSPKSAVHTASVAFSH